MAQMMILNFFLLKPGSGSAGYAPSPQHHQRAVALLPLREASHMSHVPWHLFRQHQERLRWGQLLPPVTWRPYSWPAAR